MKAKDVLLVAGTHGNEVNAPWLIEQWHHQPDLIESWGLSVLPVIGNPAARALNRRYVDRDLNRSFREDQLDGSGGDGLELERARQLVQRHGPAGEAPCRVAIDLHSTTASMGNCLVLYGRRPADLALAALVQGALGLPIYLHEADDAQTGFLVERWPCGLVIEVGPVPQSVLDAQIVRQTRLAVEACLSSLAQARAGHGRYPLKLVVHRHLGSRDLPRDEQGTPVQLLHPGFERQHWIPLTGHEPLFVTANGLTAQDRPEVSTSAVFVNEAAYAEKGIAFSFARREVWTVEPAWRSALEELMNS